MSDMKTAHKRKDDLHYMTLSRMTLQQNQAQVNIATKRERLAIRGPAYCNPK